MRVLHGVWAAGALCLWAEDPARPAASSGGPSPEPAPPGRSPEAAPHPFACQAAELADLLAAMPGPAGEAARKAVDGELTLQLPSAAGPARPLASPELLRPPAPSAPAPPSAPAAPSAPSAPAAPSAPSAPDAPSAPAAARAPEPRTGRVRLARWRVPVLVFAPAAALDLLGAAGEVAGLAVSGASLPYLAALARFADGLAARGRVLPVLAEDEYGGYTARWRPVLGGTDAQRARDLAAAMPASCRAVAGEAPGILLAAALDSLADAAARSRLPGSLLPARRGRTPAHIPVAERFVAALTSTDARLDVVTPRDQTEAAALAAELDAWLDRALIPAGPVRTCFRLTEPQVPDEDPWRVEFALQSTEDPSLMIPAADAWAGQGVGPGGDDPVEELLAGLGAATRLFGELEDALREPEPAMVQLDTRGAFRFLKETGPLLAGAGFGVLLPDWVRKARLGLKLTTRTQSASSASPVTAARFGLGDLVDFRYDLAVGDQVIDPAELAELARLKAPLVRLRGQWVELDEAHLKAALKFLAGNGHGQQAGTMTAADALLAGLRDPGEQVPLVGVDADGWLGDLLSGQADRRLPPMTAPAGFSGTLRPYQERGLSWLSFLGGLGLGGILADDMGLGKTIQLLSLIAAQPAHSGPTLLVCPMSLVGNWQREAARFTPDLRVHVHHGADRLDGDDLAAALSGTDLVITSYGVATRDRAALSTLTWARVVCDEAQNIKNHATQQARAVRSLPAATRIALTGTPVENRLSELWSIMEFTNPGLLGPAERFREDYAIPIERHGSDDAARALQRLTQPFVLRRLKTDKTIISDRRTSRR